MSDEESEHEEAEEIEGENKSGFFCFQIDNCNEKINNILENEGGEEGEEEKSEHSEPEAEEEV